MNNMEKQYRYRKHPDSVYLRNNIPSQIRMFFKLNQYEYFEISGFGKIPFYKFGIRSLLSYRYYIEVEQRDSTIAPEIEKTESEKEIIDRLLKSIDLSEYAIGFFDGYQSDFSTEIGTPDSKKEAIVRAANENHNYNSIIINRVGSGFDSNLYDAGYHFGKHYRAWEIIFETPQQFVEYFAKKIASSTHVAANKDIIKHDAITSMEPSYQLPELLVSDLAEAGFIEKEPLKWIAQPVLCAYFVDQFFSKAHSNHWNIGEKLFGVSNLARRKNNYMANKNGTVTGVSNGKPKNYQIIDLIIEKHRQRQNQRMEKS